MLRIPKKKKLLITTFFTYFLKAICLSVKKLFINLGNNIFKGITCHEA